MPVPRPALALAIASGVLVSAAARAPQAPPDAKKNVETFLASAHFTADDLARLEGGGVIARADPTDVSNEVLVSAAVKIRAPRERVINYYGQMISFVDGAVTLAFGRFSNPPVAADVKDLTLDRNDLAELKACRPGKCDMRIGGTALASLQSIDWNAADSGDKATTLVRRMVVDYVRNYLAHGDAALVTYDDRSKPVKLQDQWTQIVAGAAAFHQYLPEMTKYLQGYPAEKLAGTRDGLYWVKEDYGFKPTISVVHGVIYTPPSRPDRAIVAQKQIYASHYYDGSLAVATLVDTTDGGRPATYLIYGNRSRGDMLGGGFGGLRRATAQSQARKAAEQTLGTIKEMVEKAQVP
jgi:hypothetical protein